MYANLCACEFSTKLQQASFGSLFLFYTKEGFECRILATRSCVAILFFSPWVDLLEEHGERGGKSKGRDDRGKKGRVLSYVES